MKRLMLSGLVVGSLLGMASLQAADPVKLRYKFSAGDEHTYRNTTKLTQEISAAGQDIDTTMELTDTTLRTVERTTEAGDFRMKSTNQRMQVVGDFGKAVGKYTFDSKDLEHERGSVLAEALNPAFEGISGLEVSYTLTPQGEVKDVSGYEEAMKSLFENNPAAAAIGGGGNEAFAANMADAFPRLPEDAVDAGDTWDVPFKLDMKGIGNFEGKRVYKFEGVTEKEGRQIATISVTTELSGKTDIKTGAAQVTGTFTISESSGKYLLDLDAGNIISSELTFTVDGDLTTQAGGQTIETSLKQKQNVTSQRLPNAVKE